MRAQEDPDAKLVMITGRGEKAFIAGADPNELALLNPISGKEVVVGGHEPETGHSEFPQLPCLLEKSNACMGIGPVGEDLLCSPATVHHVIPGTWIFHPLWPYY